MLKSFPCLVKCSTISLLKVSIFEHGAHISILHQLRLKRWTFMLGLLLCGFPADWVEHVTERAAFRMSNEQICVNSWWVMEGYRVSKLWKMSVGRLTRRNRGLGIKAQSLEQGWGGEGMHHGEVCRRQPADTHWGWKALRLGCTPSIFPLQVTTYFQLPKYGVRSGHLRKETR